MSHTHFLEQIVRKYHSLNLMFILLLCILEKNANILHILYVENKRILFYLPLRVIENLIHDSYTRFILLARHCIQDAAA